ncbi:PDZ domain-containing protein [Pendulispora albinea]|uniref:PDZ domain-containing protein n=1 Tax=Pendulispora albinea TaxID=2741071 RepID=A0ABZ2M086_9BACT
MSTPDATILMPTERLLIGATGGWSRLVVVLTMLAGLAGASACGNTWTGSIGAILAKNNQNGRVFIREVPPNMGAAKAGLFVDDEVTAVDGRPVSTMTSEQLHQALVGNVGSRVRLQILRDGAAREVIVERGPLAGPQPQPE